MRCIAVVCFNLQKLEAGRFSHSIIACKLSACAVEGTHQQRQQQQQIGSKHTIHKLHHLLLFCMLYLKGLLLPSNECEVGQSIAALILLVCT